MASTSHPPHTQLTSSLHPSHFTHSLKPKEAPLLHHRCVPIKLPGIAFPHKANPTQRRPNSPKATISTPILLEASQEHDHINHCPPSTTPQQVSVAKVVNSRSKQIHARLLKLGFASNALVGEKLASLCEKVQIEFGALKIFDEMPLRTVELYASLIGLFARSGLWEDALDVFVLMVVDGFGPDRFLLPKIFKACAEMEDVRVGAAVHGYLVKGRELDVDVFVGNSLIDMYANCGYLDLSKDVFDRMLERDVVSWTALVSGYSNAGLMDDALGIFLSMQENGVEPDLISWNALISGFARNGDVDKALGYMEEMKERGVMPAVNTWNGLISGCVQNGWFEDALDVFFHMLSEDVPNAITVACTLSACSGVKALRLGEELHAYAIKCSFVVNVYVGGSIIDMYLKCDASENAEKFFAMMESKTGKVWNSMIAAYAGVGRLSEALDLIQSMRKDDLKPDVITYNTVLNACIRSGQKEEAFNRFREMSQMGLKPNIISMNTLIAGFQQCGLCREALELFKLMQLPAQSIIFDDTHIWRGFPDVILNEVYHPDSITTVSALAACTDLRLKNVGKEIHAYAIRNRFDDNVFVSSALVDMYAKCDDMDLSMKVFNGINEKNTVSWNSLLAGYKSTGSPETTLKLFVEMLTEGAAPCAITFMTLLLTCSHVSALDFGRGLHGLIVKNITEEFPVTLQSSLIDMYAKCGSVLEARLAFDCASQKDLGLWNAIISCYSLHGLAMDAIHLFEKMVELGIKPDHITFSAILSACNREGLVDEGWSYFNSMTDVHGIAPTLEHFTCMAGIMGCAGLLEEALDFVKRMPFKPDACLWSTLLHACRLHSNYEIGEVAAKQLFELEPMNASNYIVLYNIYAMSGKWDAATTIRNTMRARGLKTIKACSRITIGNLIHSFEAGDYSHPELERILEAWDEVAYEMEEAGYPPQDPQVDDDEDTNPFSCYHTEKLAICFGIISLDVRIPIRVSKNARMCIDCHTSAKLISKFYERDVLVKDGSFFHHFRYGVCSCKDKW